MFEAVARIFSSFSDALDFNEATLSGAIDVIVVKQPDGILKSSPFHVRFGKLQLLHPKDQVVAVNVNGKPAPFSMKLGEAGEAYFEEPHYDGLQIRSPMADRFPAANDEMMKLLGGGLELSLCGNFIQPTMTPQQLVEVFELNLVSYDKYIVEGKKLINDPRLMARVGDSIMKWEQVAPKLVGALAFKKPPNSPSVMSPGMTSEEVKELEIVSPGRLVLKKALRPTNDMLIALGLRQGINDITYTVQSSLQGRQTIHAKLFLYDHNTRLVISDVDGTITKSDVLGHVLPYFGKDWAHDGICELFTNIQKAGYEFLYLSARPIAQSAVTRDYINRVGQNGFKLPPGPILMSPDLVLPSLRREVVFKRPELFKIPALRDIVSLFPVDYQPFDAGFGNRETDAISYRAIGVKINKIFIINTSSEIHQYTNTDVLSYPKINYSLPEFFPLNYSIPAKEIEKAVVNIVAAQT